MKFDPSKSYSFSFPTNIRFGINVVNELPAYLKANKLKYPLIVTDPIIKDLDFFKRIVRLLGNEGINVSVFSEISKNPVKSDVLKGVSVFHDEECDSIVGIGGGAALDVARAIVLGAYHERDLFDYDDLIGGDKYVTEIVPHFVTIPTTSGTGSEVGRSAIISEDESKKKRILFSPKLLATQVFADPVLTYDLPAHVTAATGMDALTHNMEAFIAKNFHPLCEGIALEGIRLVSENLEQAVNNPNETSRANMLMASMMGAIAFQKGLGVVHSLAHPLSSLLDTHHGLANAVNIPYGMKFNYPGSESHFERIAKTLNLKDENGEAVVNWLFELNSKINIPHKLSAIGVKPEHIETLADLAFADFAHPNNPKPVSREDFKQLYLQAL
jgi:alcohol dehydrogenase class IV